MIESDIVKYNIANIVPCSCHSKVRFNELQQLYSKSCLIHLRILIQSIIYSSAILLCISNDNLFTVLVRAKEENVRKFTALQEIYRLTRSECISTQRLRGSLGTGSTDSLRMSGQYCEFWEIAVMSKRERDKTDYKAAGALTIAPYASDKYVLVDFPTSKNSLITAFPQSSQPALIITLAVAVIPVYLGPGIIRKY
ncbi:hypothetical protein PV325_003419 [Microctonus aethiopoides]|nr:hypothetical protein PV325_003419 [Microctonus aethiopoides]